MTNTFLQYLRARFFGWKPEVGAVYRAYTEEKRYNPFAPKEDPLRVKVLAVKDGFVQYTYLRWPDDPRSSSVTGFASFYVKVKP